MPSAKFSQMQAAKMFTIIQGTRMSCKWKSEHCYSPAMHTNCHTAQIHIPWSTSESSHNTHNWAKN